MLNSIYKDLFLNKLVNPEDFDKDDEVDFVNKPKRTRATPMTHFIAWVFIFLFIFACPMSILIYRRWMKEKKRREFRREQENLR